MTSVDQVDSCIGCGATEVVDYKITKTMMAPQTEDWQFQRCGSCGLVFLNPRVAISDLPLYYTDYYLPYRGPEAWGRYARLVAWDLKKIDKSRVKTVQRYLSREASDIKKTILDIGCGRPSFLAEARAEMEVNAIGVDFTDHGWRGEEDRYEDISLVVSDPKAYQDDVMADIITMWHYLEHDYAPVDTLNQLLASSHAETKLIIEVPNHASTTRRKYKQLWSGYHTPRHTALYDPTNISTMLNRAGWEVVDRYTYGTLDPYTLDWMSRMEKAKIDWSLSMEPYFKSFVIGKILRPYYYFHRWRSHGFMTVIAKPIR